MERISKHITYKEATHSNTAIRKGITNTPTTAQIENMNEDGIEENIRNL